MMNYSLMQSNPWQAVHEEFQEGGTIGELFWPVVVLAVALAGLVLFQRLQQRFSGKKVVQNPRRLFRVVTSRLRLGVLQRDLLYRIARELKLEHPAILFLSPAMFAEYTREWLEGVQSHRPGGGARAQDAKLPESINDLSHAIFAVKQPIASKSPG